MTETLTLYEKFKTARTMGNGMRLGADSTAAVAEIMDELREDAIRRGPAEDLMLMAEFEALLVAKTERFWRASRLQLAAMLGILALAVVL